MSRFASFAILSAAVVAVACGSGNQNAGLQLPHASSNSVMPPSYNCSTVSFYLGRNFGNASFVINDPAPGSYGPMDAAGDTVELASPDSIVWSWTSTALIRAIFIRADLPGTPLGDATNQVWLYVPSDAGGSYSGAGIYTEDGTNHRYPAKQIEFCFDPPTPPEYTLEVTKTAQMSYKLTKHWDITKHTETQSLILAPGETFLASFVVDAVVTGPTVSDGKGEGTISIHNPAPVDATITGVTDALSTGVDAVVDCGVTFPYTLAAGGDLACTWAADLTDLSDQSDVATVTTEGPVNGAVANAAMLAHNAAVTEVDFCADVTDSLAGPLGTICDNAQFTYSLQIGPFEACGPAEFTNTATLVTSDTGTTESSTVTIPIRVPCPAGCTLTQGYWKTHSSYGPAPYDDNWANVGEDTAFFLSGRTWYQQFWITPSGGNAYWNLAHQYAAAVLNAFNGANTDSVAAALAAAKGLLETYTPAQVAGLKGGDAVRQRFILLAGMLGAFNEGNIGPGHCGD